VTYTANLFGFCAYFKAVTIG